MKWPIVQVETKDKISLYGLFLEGKKKESILINLHGTASNFYENEFMSEVSEEVIKDISVLLVNNRGASVMQVYPHAGAALERFEDCLLDIDAWIEFAFSKGYKKIILSGHSLGTEKVVYYMGKGKYNSKISSVILFAPADSFGYNYSLLGEEEMRMLLNEAREIRKKNGEIFLTSKWICHGGVLPKGADSFINLMKVLNYQRRFL